MYDEWDVFLLENTIPYACRDVYELQINADLLSLWHANCRAIAASDKLCQESRVRSWCDLQLVLAKRHLWRESPLIPV